MAAAPRPRASKLLLLALLVPWTCSRDTATALDLRLALTGEIDEIQIQRVDIDGVAVDLSEEKTLFPASPRPLQDGDVITIWFADSAGGHAIRVTAVGRSCGRVVTDPVTTDSKTLVKDARAEAALALVVNRAASCDGGAGGGGAGAGGRGGAGGVGGTAGGAGGVGGSGGGAGGGAGSGPAGAGGGGGSGGAAGRGGAAGGTAGAQGGAGGVAGTGGGGAGGAAGASGGRGGAAGTTTGGSGGAAGAAGRGGASGGAGAGGTGGGAPTCSATSDGVCPATCAPCQATCGATQDIDCKFPNGSLCTHVNQCSSGNCVDGTCCNNACSGACDSCSTGTCTVSASGAPGSPSCSPYQCNGTSAACPTSCTSDAPCVTTAYCTGGACQPKKTNGTACAADNECTSGICVDGYCCNGRCTGACDRCNRSGSLGMCVAAPAGSAPTTSCGVYLCDGTATGCPTSCSSSSACASGYSCQGSTCQTCRAAGGSCASTNPSICCSGSCVSFQCQ